MGSSKSNLTRFMKRMMSTRSSVGTITKDLWSGTMSRDAMSLVMTVVILLVTMLILVTVVVEHAAGQDAKPFLYKGDDRMYAFERPGHADVNANGHHDHSGHNDHSPEFLGYRFSGRYSPI